MNVRTFNTLWFQLEDTVLLIGTLLLFDPVLFPKYEAWLLIGSIPNFEALLGAPLIKKPSTYCIYLCVGVSINWIVTFLMSWGLAINWNMSSNRNQRVETRRQLQCQITKKSKVFSEDTCWSGATGWTWCEVMRWPLSQTIERDVSRLLKGLWDGGRGSPGPQWNVAWSRAVVGRQGGHWDLIVSGVAARGSPNARHPSNQVWSLTQL